MKQTNTLVVESAGSGDVNEKHETHETHETGHANEFDTFEGTSIEMRTPFNTVFEPTEAVVFLASPTQGGRLSPTALPFVPLNCSTTFADIFHDGHGNNQNRDGSFETQPACPSPRASISQISTVAAEVANTAAMLDATPTEAATPEILSTPDEMDDIYSSSPIVEPVEETTSFVSVSEISRVVVEVTDTAATLDYSPGRRFFIRPGVYATDQSPSELRIGAVRMVHITDADGFLASVEQSAIESGSESDGVPEEYPSKQADDTESSASVDTDPDGGHSISSAGKEQPLNVDSSLAESCVKSCTLAIIKESRESSANEVSSAPLAGSTGENENAESEHTHEVFGQVPSVTVAGVDPGDGDASRGNEYFSRLAAIEINNTARGRSKTYSTEHTAPQKDVPSLAPPHLRKKFEPKTRPDISDPKSSTASPMSTLSIDQGDKDGSIDKFISSICTSDLATIALDVYTKSYGIATGTIQCVVDPHPRTGSHNAIYAAEFSEKGTTRKHKWVILIPLRGRCFSNAEKSWLESDIRAMEFIGERTDILIPHIYGYDHSTKNKIRAPYVLMDFMEGDRVEDVWADWDEEKRLLCLLQCAESMRKLGKFGFNRIGVLGCDYRKGEYVVRGIPSDAEGKSVSLAGPFPSTKAYLDNIWRTKAIELGSNINPEADKNRQLLVLLKLLIPALVDLDPATHNFFLSLPGFRGGNVLADRNGNVTGFVGWEKVMIMPKAMGYARYPEWIIKDWISSQGKDPVQSEKGTAKPKVVSEINRKSLTKASISSGKRIEAVKDSKGVIRGYLLEEGEDVLGKPMLSSKISAPSLPKIAEELNNTPQTIHVAQSELAGLLDAASLGEPPSMSTDCPIPSDEAPDGSGRWKRNKKGRKEGNRGGNRRSNRGNRQPMARQRQEYDESIELQRAITDEDKAKVHALSKWHALPEEIIKKEADEREGRKQARLAKGEGDKIAGAKKETPMLPKVVETFKKVVVEQNSERKLLEIVKTERKDPLDGTVDMEDTRIVSLPKSNDMVRYRKIYHGFFVKIAPEDEMATKSSHMSTAVHIAIINNDLRSYIVPKLAKHVFGAAVGPNLLGMVGNGQWAKELLAGLAGDSDGPKKGVRFAGEDEQFAVEGEGGEGGGSVWELLILGPTLAIGTAVVILGASVGVCTLKSHK